MCLYQRVKSVIGDDGQQNQLKKRLRLFHILTAVRDFENMQHYKKTVPLAQVPCASGRTSVAMYPFSALMVRSFYNSRGWSRGSIGTMHIMLHTATDSMHSWETALFQFSG